MSAAAARYKDWLARRGCIVPGCDRPASLHHVRGARSMKTRQRLPRRKGVADLALLPVCRQHHQDGWDSIHGMGEEAFGVEHLGGSTAVQEWAMTFLARYIIEEAR